jgi:hypothetical protein
MQKCYFSTENRGTTELREIGARSHNHYGRGKEISITFSLSVSVALVIQNSKSMRPIILSTVACPTLQNFPTLAHKRHRFSGEKIIEYKMCVLILSTTFV